jgi:transmembrane sensor
MKESDYRTIWESTRAKAPGGIGSTLCDEGGVQYGTPDLEAMKMKLDARIDASEAAGGSQCDPQRGKVVRKRRFIIAVCSAAACLALALAFGISYASLVGSRKAALTEVFTENGQKTRTLLPDGTEVWLNSGSMISYDGLYGFRKRDVKLKGEAFFKVAKDRKHPFVVHTSDYNVKALGTQFNVSSYADENTSETTLLEGKVEVSSPDGAAKTFQTTLEPSESISFDRASGSYSKSSSDRAAFAGAWKDNELVVAPNTTLDEFVKVLEREYNIHFIIKDDHIRKLTFEGVIKNSQLSNVLEIMSISAPISYSIDKNCVVLDMKKN